ncbi:RNA transcription, translation and transport factor protein isoform X2 [Hyalella azteca]|uniref:RNA transcription, translation and transport factor protein isoform X2 n=1 Tax=Hyalella azteca TaxID=294128 RepID=A0A8B7PP16_HYAAZ|nr:RNA transcription, translation and transport factor protein isoform X2 [Hyalella azteca]
MCKKFYDQSIRQLVVWLEDHKIRHYKIEDRTALKQTKDEKWPNVFKKYLNDLKCPHPPQALHSVTDWLLGLAVQLEYGENVEKYSAQKAAHVASQRSAAPQVVNTNPLDALDFSCPEFRDGVNKLAEILNIQAHPDHLVTLKAVSHLVKTRLSQEALASPGEVIHQGKAYPIFDADLGFEMGDKRLNDAGKVLRLLYIQDLRKLQTSINECIVATQTITANPKTDSRLGKVGR